MESGKFPKFSGLLFNYRKFLKCIVIWGILRIPQIPIFLKSIIAVGTFAGIVNINKIEFLVSTIRNIQFFKLPMLIL